MVRHRPIQFAESNGNNVDGSIDYAVYAPGQFDLSFPGEDPSHGTQYVYRYQLYDSSSPTSTDSIRKLSVGLVGVTDAANCQYVDTGPLYAGDGVAPTFQVGLIGRLPPRPFGRSSPRRYWIRASTVRC